MIRSTVEGLFGQEKHQVFIDGIPAMIAVDEAYPRESILNPTAKVAAGFEKGENAMPSFASALDDSQIASLILNIKSLK